MLKFIPDCFKTQEICEKAIERWLYALALVPDHSKTKQMYKTAVLSDPKKLRFVLNNFKTHIMCVI